MKRIVAALLLMSSLAACDKKADNSATRYAASLQEDTVKARAAAEKANAAIADEAARMKESSDLTQ
jgi:ABC-type uncharacterized transport system auxiliary subunit